MPASATDSGDIAGESWYSYAVVRVMPRVERGEFVNVGVILFDRTLGFLETRLAVDEERLRSIAPHADLPYIERHLETMVAISAGSPAGGPIAKRSRSERFHWLTSPRSTVIQVSPIHVGRTTNPTSEIEYLVNQLVRLP